MLSQTLFRLQTNRLLAQCVSSLNVLSVRDVHHHMEADNKFRYMGINRSNKSKANRNIHMSDKKFRKVREIFSTNLISILIQARGRKNVHVLLPDFRKDAQMDSMKPSDIRVMYLRRGFNLGRDVASRDWGEKQLTMQSLCKIFITLFQFPRFRRRFG